MGLAKTSCVAIAGVEARLVTVEANVGPGLPGTYVVGMADTAVSESRDRMKTASHNAGLPWPKSKVVVSLSPGSLPKSGAHFDLAMAMAVLTAQSDNPTQRHRVGSTLFMAELGLDGALKPAAGVVAALLCARKLGIDQVVVARGNAAEAALVDWPRVRVASHLQQVYRWAEGTLELDFAEHQQQSTAGARARIPDMRDVAGQAAARAAAEVAAAGGHHMLLVGPPGSGKSMIAARLPGLLPPLTSTQIIEATCIHSVVGAAYQGPLTHAPFVAPHHGISRAALLGGGSGTPGPGAVSLAHHGVLFLDECSEIPAAILDSLRTPLEEGQVRLVRRRREYRFPARFQLVLAANPCRCGAATPQECSCTARVRATYLSNLSGPLRDRLDIVVTTQADATVVSTADAEPTAPIAERVAQARERAAHRWSRAGLGTSINARVDPHRLRRDFPAGEAAMALIGAQLADGSLTQRGVDRTLKLAWTFADLAGHERPALDEVARALELHAGAEEVGSGKLAV